MDDVVDFVRKFLKTEHAALVAALSEPDEKKALAAIRLADAAYARPAIADIQRKDEIGDDERSRAKRTVERALFLVREYGGGKLYVAIVGEPYKRPYGTAFDIGLFIAKEGGALKIVARYRVCAECDGTGMIGRKACPECKGSAWSVHQAGRAIDFASLGKPTATRRLQKPDVDRFHAAYDA